MNTAATPLRPSRISAGARTNVPVWGGRPALSPGAAAWVVLDLGDVTTARAWAAEAAGLCTVTAVDTVGDNREAAVAATCADVVAAARVGTRVAVCGAEADVLLARSVLAEAGLLAEELVLHASTNDVVRVRCAHCASITRHRARPGDIVPCAPCGYDEVVHHHFSRRLAAFMAFRVDAEDPA